MPISWLLTAVLALVPLPTRTVAHGVLVPKPPPPRHAHARTRHFGVTGPMMREVARVNLCEEGGDWRVDGPTFYGGLGWLQGTWDQFRRPRWPRDMADAPPYMQANAMWRFVWHYRMRMPDQDGCTGGY